MADEVKKVPTGIEGLDHILQGGIPEGSTVLVSGACGTGKTTLGMEFLFRGGDGKGSGVFIAVTESPDKVIENMSGYEFFEKDRLGKSVTLIDVNDLYAEIKFEGEEQVSRNDVERLVEAFLRKTKDADRVVIDSITGICFHLEKKELIRFFILSLSNALRERKTTAILTSEIPPDSAHYSLYGVEDAVADGVIMLGNVEERGHLLRTLHVVKMRGTVHSRAKYVMDLTPYGIILVPLLKPHR